MSQAEVTFKFVTDASGMLQAVNQLTGEVVKLGKAEDELKKKIEAAKQATLERIAIAKELKSFNDSVAAHEAGPQKSHVERVRDSAYAHISRSQELRQAGLGSSGLTVREEAMQMLESKRRSQAVNAEAQKLGGRGLTDDLASQAGLAGMATRAGLLAAVAAVPHSLASLASASTGADRPIFATEGMRRQNFLGSLPVVGSSAQSLANWTDDAGNATSDVGRLQFRHENRMGQYAAARNAAESLGINTRADMVVQERINGNAVDNVHKSDRYQASIDSARRMEVVNLPSTERSTVDQQRRYEEGMAMLGTRRKAEKFARENDRLSEQEIQLLSSRNSISKKITEYDTEIAEKKKLLAESAKTGKYNEEDYRTQAAVQRLADLRGAEQERLAKNAQSLIDVRKEAVEARSGYRSNTRGEEYHGARLRLLEGRESESREQARTLGMSGPEQRFASEQAYNMLKKTGMEYAPAEIKAMAAQFRPHEVGAMAEAYGAKIQPNYRGEGIPELKEVRGQRDDTMKQMAESVKQELIQRETDQQKQVLDGFQALIDAVTRREQSRELSEQMKQLIQNSPLNK